MPRGILSLATVTTFLAACSAPAGPSASEGTSPEVRPTFDQEHVPVPGQANCKGQQTARVAQLNKGTDNPQGLAGRANQFGLTVPEIIELIDASCAE
jgi:hypothetical protein